MPNRSLQSFCIGLCAALSTFVATAAPADYQRFRIVPPNQGESRAFGAHVAVLPNGNVVVADPDYWAVDDVGNYVPNAGAVYLFRTAGALVSATVGTNVGDRLGSGGITVLENGHYVVQSPNWRSGRGAATWGDAERGTPAQVSESTSLVGARPGDRVGEGVTPLTNGHYVVSSPAWARTQGQSGVGAYTRADGEGRTTGAVSAQNSLVGSSSSDSNAASVYPLVNGSYVVATPLWQNAGVAQAGAVTWCSGALGCTGPIGTARSLTGRRQGDLVGSHVVALTNGNYVVASMYWQTEAGTVGAVTWGDGAAGTRGEVSIANSLTGEAAFDFVPSIVVPLANGNYVVSVPNWNNGATTDAGGVRWASGSAPIAGNLSAANSLVGTRASDGANLRIVPLSNGHYVASFPAWNSATAVSVGAVVRGDGATGTTGVVDASFALVGSGESDGVGGAVAALDGGDYIVGSNSWTRTTASGTLSDAGAVTWRDGDVAATDVVASSNSLVGAQAGDAIGTSIVPLRNGAAVVVSRFLRQAGGRVGAVTWCAGAAGCAGEATAARSIVGEADLEFSNVDVLALADGHYVVVAPDWNQRAGAVAWVDGTGATNGTMSTLGGLYGSAPGAGFGSVRRVYADGHFVIGTSLGAGTFTLGRDRADLRGSVSGSRFDTVSGASSNAGSALTYDYAASVMAVGDPLNNVVTVVRHAGDAIFRSGFGAGGGR